MSDTNIDPEVNPIENGQVENTEVKGTEAEVDYFDWNDYGDKHVKVSVSGEEIGVPLKEALAGYQRQSDYTQKTQELAEQRREMQYAQAIQQALDNDPAGTIQLLQNHYGMNQQDESLDDDDLFADPMEQQYRTLDSRIRAFEEVQEMQKLERTIESLKSRYGADFDANEVVAQALATGSNDLESTYKQVAFDRIYNSNRANSEFTSKKEAEEKLALELKRSASVVSGGSSARGTSTGSGQISSLRDAWDSAKQELGIS